MTSSTIDKKFEICICCKNRFEMWHFFENRFKTKIVVEVCWKIFLAYVALAGNVKVVADIFALSDFCCLYDENHRQCFLRHVASASQIYRENISMRYWFWVKREAWNFLAYIAMLNLSHIFSLRVPTISSCLFAFLCIFLKCQSHLNIRCC